MSVHTQGRRQPPGMILASLALFAAGCDEGDSRRNLSAGARATGASAPAAPLGPAETIIARYMERIGETSHTYELALADAGYHDALAQGALASPAEFAKGPGRIEAARAAASRHRQEALAHTDEAIAALKALPATPRTGRLIEDLALIRQRRARHWDHAAQIIDETGAAWTTLSAASDAWAMAPDGLAFTSLKAKEAYDVHTARITAIASRQKGLIAEQETASAALRALASQGGQ